MLLFLNKYYCWFGLQSGAKVTHLVQKSYNALHTLIGQKSYKSYVNLQKHTDTLVLAYVLEASVPSSIFEF